MGRVLTFLIFFTAFGEWGFAQQKLQNQNLLKQVLDHLNSYQKEYPKEKIYLHLDKPYYVAGEDIWFKAYVTVGQFNFLSAISKVMYVELINNENEIVQARRLPVVSGLAIGDFKLPDTLGEGNYRIRAYTNWMRNFDEDFFFDRTLVIGNSLSDGLVTSSTFSVSQDGKKRDVVHAQISLSDFKGNPVVNREVNYEIRLDARTSAKGKAKFDEQGQLLLDFASKDRVDPRNGFMILHIMRGDQPPILKRIPIKVASGIPAIQFFPEGGVFLAGVTNKLAFKAIGTDGHGLKVKGYVQVNGQRLTNFESDHAGMGNFVLTPEKGKIYTAVIYFGAAQKPIETKLPEVQESGYTLAVNQAMEKSIGVQIAVSNMAIRGQELSLIAQNSGQVFYAVKTKLQKNEMGLLIPKSSVPSGVIHLALFDEEMKPVAERTIFNVNKNELMPLNVQTDKLQYGTRERVNLEITAKEDQDSARIGSFSIAVTDMRKVPDSANQEVSILSSLLLSADAKGYIEQPGYYFKDSNAVWNRQLDNIMLGQQMDSDFWERIKKGAFPSLRYTSEKAIRISGTVTKPNGDPVDRAKVTVISPQEITTILDTVTGPDGRFNFDKIIFYDSTNFVVQARDARGRRNVQIKLDDVPRQKVSQNKNEPDVTVDANRSLGDYLEESDKNLSELQQYGFLERSIVLKQVEVNEKKEKNPAKYSSNLNGPGHADQVISGDEVYFNGCPSLDQCLNGRLVGVIFRNGIPYSTRSPNRAMQIIIDGMYMEPSALQSLPPFDVASVEVLRTIGNTAIYGSYGSGGILIITTRRGDQPRNFNQDLYTPGITTYSPQGFYAIRTFPSPDYSKPIDHPEKEDLRSTIYWKPDIITDAQGKAHVSFYTADEPGIYQIVVEGLDTEGHIGRSISYIKVE